MPLITHMNNLVDELHSQIPPAVEELDPQSIHRLRVAVRRLEAAIELLRPCLDEDHVKPLAKGCRKLRKRLGPVRDSDVMIGQLDRIDPTNKLTRGVEWLRQRLVEQRADACEEARRKLSASDVASHLAGGWRQLREGLAGCRDAIPSLLAGSVNEQLDRFDEHALRLSAQKATGNGHASAAADPHELRIAGKTLRYTLELAEAYGHELPKMLLRSFKQMQDCLGTWHDGVVLAEWALRASIDQHLLLRDPATQRSVLALADEALRKAHRQLNRFSTLWAEQRVQIARTIRMKFIITHPSSDGVATDDLSERRRDRGRSG